MNNRACLMLVGLVSLGACATSHPPPLAPGAAATPAAATPAAATPAAATPAAATPAAATPAAGKPAVAKPVAAGSTQNPNAPYDPRVAESDKRAKEMGYHVETRHGEQFYCRTIAPIGSRLTEKQCLTAATMAEVAHIADENQVTFQQGHNCLGSNCVIK